MLSWAYKNTKFSNRSFGIAILLGRRFRKCDARQVVENAMSDKWFTPRQSWRDEMQPSG